jgi:hypothetical protein
MKRTIIGGVAAFAILAASQAIAQSVNITIAPEQRTKIKEYVVKEKVKPAKIEQRVTVGTVLPADVELAPVPDTWGADLGRYRYVYTNDNVVLVEPSSRRVIQVIE